jgi:hypothetical protein
MDTSSQMEQSTAKVASIYVWTVWAVLTLAQVALVARYGSSIPSWEDFDRVEVSLGVRPLTPSWLWFPRNEHRMPLPLLVLVGLDQFGPCDQRAGMLANVAILALASGCSLASARRLRGGTHAITDALLPITLLGLSQAANVLWATQLQIVLAQSIVFVITYLALRGPSDRLSGRRMAVAGLLTATLPLCGASGLAYVPALALWLVATGLSRLRDPDRAGRKSGWFSIACASPALLLLVLYFRGFTRSPQHAGAEGLGAVGRALVQLASLALGLSARDAWPVAGVVVLALGVVTALMLMHSIGRRPSARARNAFLLAALAGAGSLAAGLAWGRAGSGPRIGLEERYVTMAVPLLVLPYLVLCTRTGLWMGRLLPLGLFTLVLVLAWPNTRAALTLAQEHASRMTEVSQSIRRGEPMSLFIRRHTPMLHPYPETLARTLPILKRAGVRPFDELREDPPAAWVSVPVEPTELRFAEPIGDGRTFRITNVDPWITLRLDRPRPVLAVRLKYDHANPAGLAARFILTWRHDASQAFDGPERRVPVWGMPSGKNQRIDLRIGDLVESIRIQPDNTPGTFRIESLEVLVPHKAGLADQPPG